jgi:hypothetical protein
MHMSYDRATNKEGRALEHPMLIHRCRSLVDEGSAEGVRVAIINYQVLDRLCNLVS